MLTSLNEKFSAMIGDPSFPSNYQKELTKLQVISLLESVVGVVEVRIALIGHNCFAFKTNKW